MGENKLTKAVRDNPDILVQKFLADYFSPVVVISRESAVALRDSLTKEIKELDKDEYGGSLFVGKYKTEQVGGADVFSLVIFDPDKCLPSN